MVNHPNRSKQTDERAVLVTTTHKGVFFGRIAASDGELGRTTPRYDLSIEGSEKLYVLGSDGSRRGPFKTVPSALRWIRKINRLEIVNQQIGRLLMALFQRSQFAEPDDEAGVMIDGLGRALVTWAAMQDRDHLTVAEAALVFNTTPEVIREAIEDAMWILLVNPDEPDPAKQQIETDGA